MAGTISAADFVNVAVVKMCAKPYEVESRRRTLSLQRRPVGQPEGTGAASGGDAGEQADSPQNRRRMTGSPSLARELVPAEVAVKLRAASFAEVFWQTITESDTASLTRDRVDFETFFKFFSEVYTDTGVVKADMTVLKAETYSLIELVGQIDREADELREEVHRLNVDREVMETQHKAAVKQMRGNSSQQQALAEEMCRQLEGDKATLRTEKKRLATEIQELRAELRRRGSADNTATAVVDDGGRQSELRRANSALEETIAVMEREHADVVEQLETELRTARTESAYQAEFIEALQSEMQEKDEVALEVHQEAEAAAIEVERLRKLLTMQQDELDERTRGTLQSRPGSLASLANIPLATELESLRSPLGSRRRRLSSGNSVTSARTAPASSPDGDAAVAEWRDKAERMERQLAMQNQKIEELVAENVMLRDRARHSGDSRPPPAVPPAANRKQSKVTIRVKRDVATYGHGPVGEVRLLDSSEEHVLSQSYFTGPGVLHLKHSPWTKHEDAVLMEACQTADRVDWLEAARRLPGRSDKMCRGRWATLTRLQSQSTHSCPPTYVMRGSPRLRPQPVAAAS